MPSKTYTETFVRLIGGGVVKEWVVPAKKRAVVTSLVICQRLAEPTLVQAYIANTVLYYRSVPGVAATEIFGFRAVAYAGEPIGLYQSNSGCHIQISGYLFEDPGGPGVPHSVIPDVESDERPIPPGVPVYGL